MSLHPHFAAQLDDFARERNLGEAERVALHTLLAEMLSEDTLATAAGTAWTRATAAPEALEAPVTDEDAPRYQLLTVLGRGGMGEVWRARDRQLHRSVALKAIRARHAPSAEALARFVEETQITAQLQHPGILPVHDLGKLPDGRVFYTMPEVSGHTLAQLIRSGGEAWTQRRLVESFRRACQTVAYAHARGVVHRDLKPSNLMVGAYGEVYVLDWGLAVLTEGGSLDRVALAPGRAPTSRVDDGAGTPRYMPPEQAEGRVDDPRRADVFALGAVLHALLLGEPPPRLLSDLGGVPDELAAILRRALEPDPAARFADAGEVADEIGAWLEGARKRERALAVVARAEDRAQQAVAARVEADRFLVAAGAALAGVEAWAPEADKAKGWALEDRAAERAREAERAAFDAEQLLHGALTHAPTLPEAHAALARDYRQAHEAHEVARSEQALRYERLLRAHAQALPADHPDRAAHLAYLEGDGALSLRTSVPATARLSRYVERGRRLQPEFVRDLGPTPLDAVPLGMGSWLVELHGEGRPVVRYPVHIRRQEHWDGIRPGDGTPTSIVLPQSLTAEECYVPGGWARIGGHEQIVEGTLPSRRVWVDGFVIHRDPITNRQYLAFLDDVARRGELDEDWIPAYPGSADEPGAKIYGRGEDGRFRILPDADGDVWDLDWPVCMVDHAGARAYARWWAARTGLPWRLPTELEWEKSARGVDGRIYPWGDVLDPSFCTMASSAPQPLPARVTEPTLDVSPYGVRGMAGNMFDWTGDTYRAGGAPIDARGLPLPGPNEGAERTAKGGCWCYHARGCRTDIRWHITPSSRREDTGFRLCRPLGDEG